MSGLNHRIRVLRLIVPPEGRYEPGLEEPRPVHPARASRGAARILFVAALVGIGCLWLTGYRIASPRTIGLLAHLEQAGFGQGAALDGGAGGITIDMQAARFLRDLMIASRHNDGGALAQAAGLPAHVTPDARADELLRVLRTHVESGRTDLITVAAGILALRQDGLLDAVSTLGALPPQIRQRLFANRAFRLNAWLRHENLQLVEETAAREFADELQRHRERVAAADRQRRAQIQAYEAQHAAFQTEAQNYLQGVRITYHARKQLLACMQAVQRQIVPN